MPGKKNLSPDNIKRIIARLLEASFHEGDGVRLARGAVARIAKEFGVSEPTISRIWKTARMNRADPSVSAYRASPQKHRSGRHKKYDEQGLKEAVMAIPGNERSSYRELAAKLGIPKSTIHDHKTRDDVIVPHTNSVKPRLTPLNKEIRMAYCADRAQAPEGVALSATSEASSDDGEYSRYEFCPCYDEVHVDEKWFFITEKDLKMYLAEGEEPPHRTVQNKNSIIKVMSLCAVARPRFDDNGDCTFTGKIGMWPFVETVIAQRSSVNRPAGTAETKSIKVNLATYRKYIVEKLLPAVRRVWPDRRAKVRLQHDNAKVHFKSDDPIWIEAAGQSNRVTFVLVEQGSNSPDNNVLDLGFFRPLQSIQFRQGPAKTIDGLIANVLKAYELYEPVNLEKNWLTHMSVMDCIIRRDGDNDHSLPHINKDGIMRQRGKLPRSLDVSRVATQHLCRAGLLWLK